MVDFSKHLTRKDPMTTDALAPTGLEGMVTTTRPESTYEGQTGAEHIGRDDILIPRLALAQKTSPEIDPTAPRYISGLQFTDLFNSVSKVNYGKGPLHFAILRADRPRFVEFIPLDQGGGVRDPNVAANDPRTQFGPVEGTGKAAKPIATKFYDFIVLILNNLDFANPMENVVALSMKSTALKVARQLNLFISKRGKQELFRGVYTVATASDQNPSGTFAIYKVQNAGWLAPGSQVEALAEEMWTSWKDKDLTIDADTEHPGNDAAGPATSAKDDDSIPF